MEAFLPFIVVLVMVAGAGALVAYVLSRYLRSQRERQERIAAYRRWAADHGLQYRPEDFTALTLSTQPPLGVALGRRPADVFRGAYRGAPLHCFELQQSTSRGDGAQTLYFQVVAIGLPASRPLLDIGHETSLSRRFGEDIAFENQAFNDRFEIQSPNPRFAHDVIHSRMMEWMLADPRAQSREWRFEGPWLMSIRSGRLDLGDVFPCADFLHEVLARVPRHVWSRA